MPTLNHVKQIDTVDMKLWKSSSIHKFISDRCCPKGSSVPSTPSNPPVMATKQADRLAAEDILNMLSSFRQSHIEDQELSQQLQQITSELKSSFELAKVYQDSSEKQPARDKYSKLLDKIDSLIEDSGMHIAVRAALIRKELRDIGVFTWNSDLEGMIFGYGDSNHCQQLVSKMPQSMKEFCMSQSTLSGASFVASSAGAGISRPSVRDPTYRDTKKASVTPPRPSAPPGSASIDDAARVSYLVAAAAATPSGSLLSSDLPKRYHAAFGMKFQCEIGGVALPFSVLLDKLREGSHIQVTLLDSSQGKGTPRRSRPATPASTVDEEEDDDGDQGDEGGDYESPFAVLSELDDDLASDGESVASEASSRFDEADEIAEAFEAKSEASKWKKATTTKSKGKGKAKGKAAVSKGAAPETKMKSVGDDGPTRVYRLQWIGPPPQLQEPPDHIFRNPDYWTFVGSILHGAKDRGGMWKRLPWAVLKDVIASTKSVKVADNMIGRYLTSEDLRKYGRQSSLVPLHIGLQDLVDWMDEMTAKSLIMTASSEL
jgi:hypothetical protein